MPILRNGLSGLNQGKNFSSNPSKGSLVMGRVVDIILDENHPKFNETGLDLNGIGLIYFENLGSNSAGEIKTAKPFFPNIRNYPLVGEYVQCFFLAVPTAGAKRNLKKEFYYVSSVNLWNTPHYNGLPQFLDNGQPFFQQQTYDQVEAGAYRISGIDSETTENPNSPINASQDTFVEKEDIHPLMPFAGDVIHEGRFGNSIRLGNTAKSLSIYSNNWSTSGENGDPITILRNGQRKDNLAVGFLPVTEDINQDLSSIYLTSYQSVNLKLSAKSLPTPSSYKNPQILFNSSRLVLNAKDDIIVSGQNQINISSPKISLYSDNVNISSTNITLGNTPEVMQPVLLGNDTVETLKNIVVTLRNLADTLYQNSTATGVKIHCYNAVQYLNNDILPYLNREKGGIKSSFVKIQ
jgi:hypothetical protein